MDEIEQDWQRMAKVAIALQGDDPVNWPHYAGEAKKLVDENESLGEALREIANADSVDMALDPGWPARIAKAALHAISER